MKQIVATKRIISLFCVGETRGNSVIKTTPAALALLSTRHTRRPQHESAALEKMKKVCVSNRIKGRTLPMRTCYLEFQMNLYF